MKYDYICECKEMKIIEAPIGKAEAPVCKCGKTMVRFIIAPRVVFKGSGFSLQKMR